ncbi:cyclic nucleotide-binding domain-containing protein [Olivibacter sp. SDN3]|uniref:cyclic nucleotide-binding domain-containing protein n=1 Tax=Olivibacter sp. SDN3 TaxID=2764720 RepID=UPI001651419E|nr:cyclic nucleotide-binding domain-containing protein [Olivibacter sp. SDN3]QNL48217.1 cyclic nucleotide-binding domain-containing protein [Olivibacter sp. SDN3]
MCHIHKKVEYIHWLLAGSVRFYVALNEGDPEIEVCQFTGQALPIGWNGLNPPGRHTKNVLVASERATFFRVELHAYHTFLHTLTDVNLHIHVCKKQFLLLKKAVLNQQSILPPDSAIKTQDHDHHYDSVAQQPQAIMGLLKRSPFFEFFEDTELMLIAKQAVRREYRPDDVVFQQDTFSDGLYILIEGNIRMERIEHTQRLSQWPISDQGFIFGWPCMIAEKEICTAYVVRRTSTYFIENTRLNSLLKSDNSFALRFYTRLNWLVDNHINAAFIRFLSLHFNANQLTIQYLIESYQTQIKASSELHQIPHLLKHRTTKYLAFEILHQLIEVGTSRERRIASICLDLLRAEKQEMLFLRHLQEVYEVVTDTNREPDAAETRKACSAAVRRLCTFFDYQMEGWHHLPDKPGHIFIYNHLLNHPDYTLNNNFQITLESHFISAMILDVKYGDPGIRTVRIGRSREFAHQDYYEKLGYINVFTKESDSTDTNKRDAARNHFFDTAKAFLLDGYNIIISPEGTSYRTEDDIPGEFKPGAFRLALETDPEPMIVPIVMLYFDKRIHEAKRYCEILKPFKISEHPLFDQKLGITDFVNKYRSAFKQELEQAKRKL